MKKTDITKFLHYTKYTSVKYVIGVIGVLLFAGCAIFRTEPLSQPQTFTSVKTFTLYDSASYQELKEPEDSIIIICSLSGKGHANGGKDVVYRPYLDSTWQTDTIIWICHYPDSIPKPVTVTRLKSRIIKNK